MLSLYLKSKNKKKKHIYLTQYQPAKWNAENKMMCNSIMANSNISKSTLSRKLKAMISSSQPNDALGKASSACV